MNAFAANWKTTVPGIIALASVVYHTWQTKTLDWNALQDALVGLGLIAAKDFNVTGGDKSV